MSGRRLRGPPHKPSKTSTNLRFLGSVLGLERLHYGLWDSDPLTMEGLRAAQGRYSAFLRSWIPAGVRRVLDAGCGLGTDAAELAGAGYEVEGLSPDPYLAEEFVRRTGLPFHAARLQDFDPPSTFDLVLMSESVQYVPLADLFGAVRRAAPGGFLLAADYFRAARGEVPMAKSGHPEKEFLAAARAHGLLLERQEDITGRVAPTLDLASSWVDRYVEPTVHLADEWLAERHPALFRISRRLLRGRLARATALRQLLDSAEFQRTKRYLVMLWRIPA